jgi:hypothetical protein
MRNVLRVLVALALLAMSIVGAQPASGTGAHCAYRLDPIRQQARSGVVAAKLRLVGCYPRFRDALASGSGGSIQLAAGASPASLTEEELVAGSSLSARASVLIGTEYNGQLFGGASNSYWAATTCTASTTWEVANVGGAWNDMFESGKGFGGCRTNKKFRNTNFTGSVVTCTPTCSNYGSLVNQVSSLKWRT